MHRIDTPGSVAGMFALGSPQLGQKATRLGHEWPNAIQEEIISVLTLAGIAPNKLLTTQLRDAIVNIVTGAVGTGGGAVPTTRQVNGGGLVTGGGPLAADLTLTVTKALAAAIVAGTADTSVITPLQLASAIGDGAAGFIRLPGGTMLQWVTGLAAGNTSTLISLPTSFSTQCYFAGVAGGEAGSNAKDNNPHVSGTGVSAISLYSAVDSAVGVQVFAWGK